jgi:hypothetical protein
VVTDPMAPKAPHFPAKAKHVVHLFMNGGPSHVDTFDPKPMLDKYHGKALPTSNLRTEGKTGVAMRSPFPFRKHGKSGIEVSDVSCRYSIRGCATWWTFWCCWRCNPIGCDWRS